jgi:LacI family transcriptional regulator
MITINDVARRSGFSKTTVSFVLNDAPLAKNIGADTKARIKRVAKELGYRPNQFARYLRSKRSNMIGVVLFDISDPYCVQILRGVEQALYNRIPTC